jgi:GNAT superfamily N-acetyltransferase
MSRRLSALTLDNLCDLPDACRGCVVWELDPVAGRRAAEAGDTAFEKEAWVSATLLQWGSCGRVAYVDDEPAGFVLYAPPALVPRSVAFPTSPVSPDAVLLMTLRVLPRHSGAGLARMLIQAVAKDLTRRGVRAIEAFGLAFPSGQVDPSEVRAAREQRRGIPGSRSLGDGPDAGERTVGPGQVVLPGVVPPSWSGLGVPVVDPESIGPGGPGGPGEDPVGSGKHPSEEVSASLCMMPADLLLAVGFKTVRPHPRFPRLRLELKTTVSWREDVELAIERILGTVRTPALTSMRSGPG